MTVLTALEIAAYAVAAALYLGFLIGFRERAAHLARLALAAAVALQFVDIGIRCVKLQHPASSAAEATAFVGWMIGLGYLLASFRHRLAAAGAFAVPAVLILVVLARVVPAETTLQPGAAVGTLGRVHILLATVGVAVFTLAAVVACLYLLEERRLKRKQFDRLLETGAPLETLDRLAGRCVSLGFPIFTVALITGAVWVARLGLLSGAHRLKPEYVLALVAWLVFGVLLVARFGVGWQGRRAAWLTLGGFGGAMVVLVLYVLRHVA